MPFPPLVRELQQQLAGLKEENEILIQSNEQMATVLEGVTGGESGKGDGGGARSIEDALSNAEVSEQIRQLEATTQRQLEVIELQQNENDAIQQSLETQTQRAERLDNLREEHEAEIASLKTHRTELETNVAALKEELAVVKKARNAENEQHSAQAADLSTKLSTMTNDRDDLIAIREDLTIQLSRAKELAEEAAKLHQEKVVLLEEEKADYKERLNDAIQERWNFEQALRSAGVNPDEAETPAAAAAAVQKQQADREAAMKAFKEQVQRQEVMIKDMRAAYDKTKSEHAAELLQMGTLLEEKEVKVVKLTNLVQSTQEECDSLTKEVEDMSLTMATLGENLKQTEAAALERSNVLKLRIGELEDELEETRDLLKLQISEQTKQQEEFVLLIDHKENEGKALMRQLRDANSDLEELTKKLDEVLLMLKGKEMESQKLELQIEQQTTKIMQLQSEIVGQRSALEAGGELEKQLADVSSRVANAEAQVQELTTRLADSHADVEKRKVALAALEEDLAKEKKLHRETVSQSEIYQGEIRSHVTKGEQFTQRIQALQAELEANKTSMAEERKKMSALNAKLEDTQSMLDAATRAAEFARKQYADLEKASDSSRADFTSQLESLRAELRQAEADRAEDASKAAARLEVVQKAAAAELSETNAKLDEHMRVLGDLTIQVATKESELRTARDAALMAQGAVSADMQVLKTELLQAQDSAKHLDTVSKELASERDRLRAVVEAMTKERDDLSAKVGSSAQTARASEAELQTLRTKMELVEKQLAATKEEQARGLEAHTQELESLKRLMQEKEDQIVKLKEQRSATERDLDNALQDAEAYAASLAKVNEDVMKFDRERGELVVKVQELETLRSKLADAESKGGDDSFFRPPHPLFFFFGPLT